MGDAQSKPASCEDADRKILLVDDEAPVRMMLREFLSERYVCETAASTKEALDKLAAEPFALVISDMLMPGLSGVELLREVLAQYPDTAFIMLSGVNRAQRVMDAVRLGAFDYLVKPCDLDVLERCVERALERRMLKCEARRYKEDLERRNEELAAQKLELERLQARIVHSEKMASLGQLAAGVAHELNNPAGFIIGNMEILKECASDLERLLLFYEKLRFTPEDAARVVALQEEIGYEHTLGDLRSIIEDCREGAERIRDIVQNLRTFSRLDEAELKRVDLHEGIDSTIRLLSRYYSAPNITLERDYGKLPAVECFAGQLNQVWMNLLVNAAQAVSGKGVRVRVATRLEEEMAVVSISDTGPGIPPENLGKIFDPFFTTKPVGEGTGLGLSITYGIITRHGGRVTVESSLGQGTTFTVYIPINAHLSESVNKDEERAITF